MQMWNGLGNVEGVGKIKAANANLKIEEKVDTLEFMKVVPISFSFRKFCKFCLQYSFLPFWGFPAV